MPLWKKKSDASAPEATAWHPNLRIVQRLPDTKVVRTAFFINGAAVAVALALALYLGVKEWEIRSFHIQIEENQRQIDRDRRESDRVVALYNKFKADQARAEEVQAFLKSEPLPSEILLRIAQTLPRKVALDSFDLRETGLTLRGTVRGAPDQASGDASAYVAQLQKDPYLAQLFGVISLTSLSRNPQSGRIIIEVLLEAKKGKKS